MRGFHRIPSFRRVEKILIGVVCAAAVAGICVGTSGCTGDTIEFGSVGDDDDVGTVTFGGDIRDVTPRNPARDLVIFVFTDLTAAALAAGPPFDEDSSTFTDIEAVIVEVNYRNSRVALASGYLPLRIRLLEFYA